MAGSHLHFVLCMCCIVAGRPICYTKVFLVGSVLEVCFIQHHFQRSVCLLIPESDWVSIVDYNYLQLSVAACSWDWIEDNGFDVSLLVY